MARRDRNTSPYEPWLEQLFRRFALTIPLRRPVVVRYQHIINATVLEAEGLPAHCRPHMLYVMTTPGRMVAIPKASVLEIRPLYPNNGDRLV